MSRLVALIPLRGGSKSIPDKNVRPIAGKPLCAWVLEAATASGLFDKVIVSTDSQRIAEVVDGLELGVEILDRPPSLATDTASTESVMLHLADQVDFDVLVTIQATSPLLTAKDLQDAMSLFESEKSDSLLSAVRVKRFFWNDDGTPANYDPANRPRRQDFAGTLMENGAFYITRRHVLEDAGCRLGGQVAVYEMSPESAVEIDEPEDWPVVERLLQNSVTNLKPHLKEIKLLVVDVDGTLTDAGMYYTADGDLMKKFNTRDAKGLARVRELGVQVALMTSEDSPIVKARARKLELQHCYLGVDDKLSELNALCRSLGIPLEETAYVGDDLNDLDCLEVVGFSACPRDAVPAVKSVVNHVSCLAGGEGAVREVCEMIIEAKE